MSLVQFQSIAWSVKNKLDVMKSVLAIDASLALPVTVNVGAGVDLTFHFAIGPRLDPKVKLNQGWLDFDLGACPWYAGLTPPPADLARADAHQDRETKARKELSSKLLQAAGSDIRQVLSDLQALPARVFQALHERLSNQLDSVFALLPDLGDFETNLRARLDGLMQALYRTVRDALGWLVSLARDVGRWLLTTAAQLGALAADGCRAVVEALLVLHEGVLDGAERMAGLLRDTFVLMAKDPIKLAQQLRGAALALIDSAILRTKEFAADLEHYLAAGIAALVDAYGTAEQELKAFFAAVAEAVVEGTAKAKLAAREACNFFSRLMESAVVALHKVSDDPALLCVWIGKLIRWGLEAYVACAKAEFEFLLWGAHAIGRALRGLGAVIDGFAEKAAEELKPYVKPALEALADLAKRFGKATREGFTAFLQKLAGWSRTAFHAVCLVLKDAEALLIAFVGPENIEAVKKAIDFLCDFFAKVSAQVNRAIDGLNRFGRFVAVDIPRMYSEAFAAFNAKLAKLASSLGAALEEVFHIVVLEVGGYVRSSPIYQAIAAIVKVMLELAQAAGAFLAEKGRELGDWIRPKLEEAMGEVEKMAQALAEFMDGTVIEARFRRLQVAAPRPSKRSQAKIKLLPDLPSAHKLPGDDVLLPVLQALADNTGLTLGALELHSFSDWRLNAPHPVSGLLDVSPQAAAGVRLLPLPFAPDRDVVFRMCTNPRMWVIDPRYSWGYGASNQLRIADIDGDGKVDEWEVWKEAQKRRDAKKTDPDADPFTAADLQTLLDQAQNVLHGVPYRQIGAPFGLLAGYGEGSWTWFSIASIGDEDVGAAVTGDADPKAPLGSALSVGAGGTVIPSGQKVNRTGLGIFWQGMQTFGAYPVRYHVEKRLFFDQFASGFGNPGTSTFLVVRGGKGGNDFQLRGELYRDLTAGGVSVGLPIGMYTPTIRASFAFTGSGGAAVAGQGGFRLGLEYASKSPIAVLFGDEAKDPKQGVVDGVLKKLQEDFKLKEILPLLQKALVPVLRIVMFDQEYEAKLICAGAVAIGAELAIAKKKTWAQQGEGRRRTLRVLEQAETFLEDWKLSEEVRRKDAELRAQAQTGPSQPPAKLDGELKALWAASRFSEEQRLDLTEIAQLHRGHMRAALKEKDSAEPGLEDRFAAWVAEAREPQKLAAFESWLADQRQSHYLAAIGKGAVALKNQIWAGDISGAWGRIRAGLARIDASTSEYADEICECIIAVAALVDIFHRMATALGDAKGLRKKVSEDLDKRRKEKEAAAGQPKKPGPKILGRLGAEAHDDTWAQEVLMDSPSWGKQATGLADGLSIAWSIDGGVGVGVGASGGGSGLGAFATLGLSVNPPSFKLPSELLAKLSSKLMLVRFLTKFMGALFEVIEDQVAEGSDLPTDSGSRFELALAWYVQAIHQTLCEVLTPGATPGSNPRRGAQTDPFEDWLYSFLSGTTITVGGKVEALAKGVGTVLSAEARGGMGGEVSISLASLLDPLVEAIQLDAKRTAGPKQSLGKRIVPKLGFTVKQNITLGAAVGPAQFDVGLAGQSLAADVVLPDSSPWRREVEVRLNQLIGQAVQAAERRGRVGHALKGEGGVLHGLAALCDAIDSVLRAEIPSVIDWETKNGADDPAKATALVTNPMVQRMFDIIKDPAAAEQRQDEKQKRIDELIEAIRGNELHFATYPDQPGVGLKATPASSPKGAFNVSVLLPDAEVEQLTPKTKVLLERRVCRIPLAPAPAHVAQETFRKKSDPKGAPLSGIVVGFAKKSEAEAFAGSRSGDWVDAAVAGVPPWTSPRAGVSGTAQWYHWLNTKVFGAVEEARGKGKLIDQPLLAVDDKGVLLTFGLVDRGLLDKAPFSAFGFTKESETLLTEATLLEGAWEDDVVRLRTELAASLDREGKPAPAPAAPEPPPAADAAPTPPAPATVRYQVRRAQAAVNHQVREHGIPGWTKPLAVDGHFGPKTGAALDAWAKSVGAPAVTAERGAEVIEVSPSFAKVLDEAQTAAVVAFAPPQAVPEDDAPWMAVARGELGQKEIKGAEDNPRIREYHGATTMGEKSDEVAWCSSFVNWVMAKAKLKGTRSAAAASWVDWGAASEPRRGAVVVIYNAKAANSALSRSGNHVGFLIEDVGWGWKLLGGNQGDMVKESCFSKKSWTLKAVRWPT